MVPVQKSAEAGICIITMATQEYLPYMSCDGGLQIGLDIQDYNVPQTDSSVTLFIGVLLLKAVIDTGAYFSTTQSSESWSEIFF